jgi:hypothetical protein
MLNAVDMGGSTQLEFYVTWWFVGLPSHYFSTACDPPFLLMLCDRKSDRYARLTSDAPCRIAMVFEPQSLRGYTSGLMVTSIADFRMSVIEQCGCIGPTTAVCT